MADKRDTPAPLGPPGPQKSAQPGQEVPSEHDTTLKWFLPSPGEVTPTPATVVEIRRDPPGLPRPTAGRPPVALPLPMLADVTRPNPPPESTPTPPPEFSSAPKTPAPEPSRTPPPDPAPKLRTEGLKLPPPSRSTVLPSPARPPAQVPERQPDASTPAPAQPRSASPTASVAPASVPHEPATPPPRRTTTPPPPPAIDPPTPPATTAPAPLVAKVPPPTPQAAGEAATTVPATRSDPVESAGATPTELVLPYPTPPAPLAAEPADELGAAPVSILPGPAGSDAELAGDAVELIPGAVDEAAVGPAAAPAPTLPDAKSATAMPAAPLTQHPQPVAVSEPREVEPEAIEMVESSENPTADAAPAVAAAPPVTTPVAASRPTLPAPPATSATPPAAPPPPKPSAPATSPPAPPPAPAAPTSARSAPPATPPAVPAPAAAASPPVVPSSSGAPPLPARPRTLTPPPVPLDSHSATPPPVRPELSAPHATTAPPVQPAKPVDASGTTSTAGEPLPEALARRSLQKRSKPWYEEIFDEDFLRTLPFSTAAQTKREADFIRQALSPPDGAEILDVGCGYGRHAIELAQSGYRVTGLDLSLPLLIRAADEAQRRSLAVNFVHADMREMSFAGQFDSAYCVLSSFGYFDEDTNLRVATGICRALKPGGRFVLDILNRDYIVGDLPSRVWWEGDGCVVLEEVDFNFHTSRVVVRRSIVFGNGRQSEQEISLRAYSLHEVGKLLRQAGLRIVDVSGGLATKSRFFGAASRNIIAVCERPAT